jgi:uncharacterized OB-fold protein
MNSCGPPRGPARQNRNEVPRQLTHSRRRPISQGIERIPHTCTGHRGGQATAHASASEGRQHKLCTHVKAKTLTRGYAVRGGTRTAFQPWKHEDAAETCGNRPGSSAVRRGPRRTVWTLSTPHFSQPRATQKPPEVAAAALLDCARSLTKLTTHSPGRRILGPLPQLTKARYWQRE